MIVFDETTDRKKPDGTGTGNATLRIGPYAETDSAGGTLAPWQIGDGTSVDWTADNRPKVEISSKELRRLRRAAKKDEVVADVLRRIKFTVEAEF